MCSQGFPPEQGKGTQKQLDATFNEAGLSVMSRPKDWGGDFPESGGRTVRTANLGMVKSSVVGPGWACGGESL